MRWRRVKKYTAILATHDFYLIYDDKVIYEDVPQSLVTFYHLPSSSQLVRYFIIRCRSFGAPKARKARNRII